MVVQSVVQSLRSADIEEGLEVQVEVPFQNEDQTENQNGNQKDDKGRKALGMMKENTPMEIIAGGLAFVSMTTAVASMIVVSGIFINVAGVLALLLGPYSYWQQRNIGDVKALKETHEVLVKEIDQLKSENERLKGLVEELGGSVEKLEVIENTLDQISQMNIESVEELSRQVQESRAILGMMKRNVKASALQNIITVVLNSDKDGNYTFEVRFEFDLFSLSNFLIPSLIQTAASLFSILGG